MRRLCGISVLSVVLAIATGFSVGAPPAGAAVNRWEPKVGASFQWQLQGRVDTSVKAKVFDIDMFDSSKALVRRLHRQGRHVVCYLSAGSFEKWRPDADSFPKRVLGKPLDGWPGERWLDVRKLSVLKPIMRARLDRCENKRFDAVEFDNVDGYENDSGFPLTKRDQLAYLSFLSRAAHAHGLAAGLKNLPQLARELEPEWDFVVNEQCFQYNECGPYRRFISHGKPVFQVEYELSREEFCPRAAALGFTSMRKRLSLRAWRMPCPLP